MRIRSEIPDDIPAIHEVNRLAFGSAAEADLVDALRRHGQLTISLVAELEGVVVGHIAFSPVMIDSGRTAIGALGLAPMAVHPEQQRGGIGSSLVRQGLVACHDCGHSIVVVVGHPAYYPRFGFLPAAPLGLRYPEPGHESAFMVVELVPGALAGRTGVVHYSPEFAGL